MTGRALPPSPQRGARFTGRGLPPLQYTGRWRQQPPVWLEGRGVLEYLRLLRHPIYRGAGVPGAGAPVLLVPGLMAGDSSLSVLRNWLLRSDYHVEVAGLVFNIRYSDLVARLITLRLQAMHRLLGRKVTIVGHSRGGMLAKVVADRQPDAVARVIALGAPIGAPYDIHPLTMAGVRVAHALNVIRYARGGGVERSFLKELEAPAQVPLVSIYSRTDGIVHWEACLRADAECLEVAGSHLGLGVNAQVYQLLAGILPSTPAAQRTAGQGRRRRVAPGIQLALNAAAPSSERGPVEAARECRSPNGQPPAAPPGVVRAARPRPHGRL
jgi:triacylglycerol lipase